MAYYSQEKIDEVNDSADLVELVSSYVNLKRTAAVYKGLCPFHSEKTPSFVVTPHKRMFHCFGCGVGGGPIRFLMMISGRVFPEAVEELARRYGVELPVQDDTTPAYKVNRENRGALIEIAKKANEYFIANLWSQGGYEARHYLAGRGFSENMLRDFSIGYSKNEWEGLYNYLSAHGFGDKIMIEAGLIKTSPNGNGFYDVFRHRVMLPIVDTEGRVTAFGGRTLSSDENQAKYINSPETPIYKKGSILYGFHRARPFLRSAGLVFIVEGYFDLISMVNGGINEVVAPLGTALTAKQLNLLRGHVERVLLLFDSDEAGLRAAANALPLLLNAELDGRVMALPKNYDPDNFIREFGVEALYEAASSAMEIVDFVAGRLKNSFPSSVSGQARMLRATREILSQIPDEGKRWILARSLAQKLDMDKAALGVEKSGPKRQLSHRKQFIKKIKELDYDQTAGELLKHILIHPECANVVFKEMPAWWPEDASRPLFERLKKRYELNGSLSSDDAFCDESESLAALVSEAALSERLYDAEVSSQVSKDYMGRIKEKWFKIRHEKLSAAIRKAEFEGDNEELSRLFLEKNSLLKSEKELK